MPALLFEDQCEDVLILRTWILDFCFNCGGVPSLREIMSHERNAGRGRGRNSRGGRFGGRGNVIRGLTPSIGADLDYAPGREANIIYTTLRSKKER